MEPVAKLLSGHAVVLQDQRIVGAGVLCAVAGTILAHWDVDAQCPEAVSSSLTADQPLHTVGTICAQIARYSLRQTTGMAHTLTIQVTKHESTIESKSKAHPSN